MTSFQFEELILELLGRNQQDFKIDGRVAIALAQTVYGKILADKVKNGEPPSSFYTFGIFDVQQDSQINRSYIKPIPKVMSIGDNDGIGQIGHVFNEYDSFVLLKPSQLGQYSELEAGKMGGRIAAIPQDDRIYILNLPETTEKVMLRYIPQLVGLPEDFELFGGSDLDHTVILEVLRTLGYKAEKPEDKLDDNTSN